MRKMLLALVWLVPALAGAQATLTPEQQLQQAQQALEQARQALQQAEAAKQQAEKAVEAQRQSEAAKAKADSLRREAERINAETERIKTETERIKAETATTAQTSGWVIPSAQQQATKKPAAKSEEKKKDKTDPKYLNGAVTTDDGGNIVFRRSVAAKGHSADEVYAAALGFLQQLVASDNQLQGSRLALVNPDNHSLAATVKENMVFSSTPLSIDQTEVDYTLVVTCSDGEAGVEVARIAFNYEPGRPTGFRAKAEDVISDKMAMNRKHTALNRLFGKFRRGTIDRVDQITSGLAAALQF